MAFHVDYSCLRVEKQISGSKPHEDKIPKYYLWDSLFPPKLEVTDAWEITIWGSQWLKTNRLPVLFKSYCQTSVRHGAEILQMILKAQGELLGD